MSTKRLSKTVIEGGRHGFNKWERRHSHAEVRAEERDYLKQVMSNLELADEIDIDATRPVMKEFTDKLSPMYRWLEAQVGRPWDEVRSEVFTKFDSRTTSGRHILFDHLLRDVVDTDSGFDKRGNLADPNIPKEPSKTRRYWYWSTADYYVDQGGILRFNEEPTRRRWNYSEKISDQEFKEAEAWLQNRMVGEIGGKLYWFTPTEGIWKASWFEPFKTYDRFTPHSLTYFSLENGLYSVVSPALLYSGLGMTGKTHGDYWEKVEKPAGFRRRGELTSTEVKAFRAFKEKIRDDMLSFTKDR